MDINKSEKFRGIVIASKSDHKSGKILDIYTVELGRIKAYVRSAYDLRDNVSRSSFVFTESEFSLSQYKDIFMVNDSKVLFFIRTSYDFIKYTRGRRLYLHYDNYNAKRHGHISRKS